MQTTKKRVAQKSVTVYVLRRGARISGVTAVKETEDDRRRGSVLGDRESDTFECILSLRRHEPRGFE